MIRFFLATLFFISPLTAFSATLSEALDRIPIQDAGRVKPFGTFARESLQQVHGKMSYEGKGASEVVFTWLLIPDQWLDMPLIELRHGGLKEALKIDSTEKRFTPKSLLTNERIPLVMQELQTLRGRQEKLNPYFQAVQRLEHQLSLFQAVRAGIALRFIPDPQSDTWKAVNEMPPELQPAFTKMTKAFVDSISLADKTESKIQATPEFEAAINEFMELAGKQAPQKYAKMERIGWEIHLNRFHPFKWSAYSYLFGLILMIMFSVSGRRWTLPSSLALIAIGFVLQTYGMGLRSYLTERPPVTNMYETVIWVPWSAVLIGFILAHVQKNRLVLMAGSGVAVFCLLLTDLAPTVLDASLNPLEPVLRSTFWLMTHVLIITLSYAAFFLAMAVADVLLIMYLKDEKKYAAQIKQGCNSIYRSLQIGVVLLAAGTILGGVWADYSWGRFWGWDPKETWALISLLGYLAVLHGRLVGWIKDFELVICSIITFSLVVMAWYGVNFALGAGLHTYGFGAGGVEYVSGFVVLHTLFVVYVATVRYGRLKNPN